MTDLHPRPVTDAEKATFDAITSGEYDNFACVSTVFDGEQTACIAAVTWDNAHGEYTITPVAILVTDAMFDRMTDPSEGLT